MIIHVKGDVIELKGSLMENYWLALKSAVSLQLRQHPNGIVIDGHELTEIDEAGARTFLEASDYIQAHMARVVISGLSEHVLEEIRQIPGARSQLPLAATVEEARASLAVGGAEAVPETRRRPAVLVPLVGDWPKALEYAVPQASARKAEIHTLYVLQVPRAMPLGVPLPDKERDAQTVLSDAEQKLKRTGLTVRKLTTRSRTGVEGIARFASETGPELLLAAYPKSRFEREHDLHTLITGLCQETSSGLAVFCTGVPEEAPDEECRTSVLVPLLGAWPEAAAFAATQAASEKAEIHLLCVLQVPRTQPLDVPLPNEEQAAQESLLAAERSVKRHGVTAHRHVFRSRSLFDGIARFAEESKPGLVILSYFRKDLTDEDSRYTGIATLCHEAPCDVAVVCLPEHAAG